MTTTATPTDTTSDIDAKFECLITGHVTAATDARDIAATFHVLERHHDGSDYDGIAEHHTRCAGILNG